MATSVGQVFQSSESIGALSRTGANTAELAVSVVTVGGLQYTTDVVKTLDVTISGVGGLDTGAVAAFSTYNVFAIKNGSDVSLIASLSTTPSGHTSYKNIGKLNTVAAGAINGASEKDVGSVGDSKYSMLLEEDFILQNGGGWILSDGRDVTGSVFETLTGNTNVPDGRGQFLRGKNNSRSDGQENPNTVLTGSIETTASTAVVGVGTLFLTELSIGDNILVGVETREISAIADDTNLTVTAAFPVQADDTSPEKVDKEVALGTFQVDGLQGHEHSQERWAAYNGSGIYNPNNLTYGSIFVGADGCDTKTTINKAGFGTIRTASETRPKNITMNLFIKIN